jgi:exopolyphosphatase/guanosine-5'-triphosphate,3'-diphosphate pyrophosphatase
LEVDATYRPGMNRARRKPGLRDTSGQRPGDSRNQFSGALYGALDLGTNNCRLLIATPTEQGFSVVDAFSRIVRLGERLAQTGRLSEEAMSRTIDALRVCANKLKWRNVARVRLVATEACRIAENGPDFIERVREETGLGLEIIDRETEASGRNPSSTGRRRPPWCSISAAGRQRCCG